MTILSVNLDENSVEKSMEEQARHHPTVKFRYNSPSRKQWVFDISDEYMPEAVKYFFWSYSLGDRGYFDVEPYLEWRAPYIEPGDDDAYDALSDSEIKLYDELDEKSRGCMELTKCWVSTLGVRDDEHFLVYIDPDENREFIYNAM